MSLSKISPQHGSFGGVNITTGEMYAAGSDDFRNYIWKIPPTQWLLDQRQQYSADKWEYEVDPKIIGESSTA
jgi:WD repeat-containing protein 22